MPTRVQSRRALLKRLRRPRPKAKGSTPNPLRADPSKTAVLRRRFTAELKRRFSRLKRELVLLAQVEDAFGVHPQEHRLLELATSGGPLVFATLVGNARQWRAIDIAKEILGHDVVTDKFEDIDKPNPTHRYLLGKTWAPNGRGVFTGFRNPDSGSIGVPLERGDDPGHMAEAVHEIVHAYFHSRGMDEGTHREREVNDFAERYLRTKLGGADLQKAVATLREAEKTYGERAGHGAPVSESTKQHFFSICHRDDKGHCTANTWVPAANKFCATGEGGKVDPSCGKDDTGSGGGAKAGATGGKEFSAAVPSPASAAFLRSGATATAFKATLSGMLRLGAQASHLEHLASSYLKDKLGDGISRLPQAVQAAVHGSLAVSRVGVKGLFANWTAAQALAERVSQEKGSTPEQARRLRGVLSSLDMKTFEVLKVGSLAGAHVLHGPMAAATLLPPATAGYLAYNTARHPMATLRAATGLVKDAAASVGGKAASAGRSVAALFPSRAPRPPRPQRRQARPGLEELTRNRSANDRVRKLADELAKHQYDDWYVALLSAALTETGSLEEALKVAAKAHKTTPKNPTDAAQPPAQNAFCPTGEGGGIDPTCSPGEARASSPVSLADLSKSTQFLGNIPGGGKPTKAEAIAKVLLERAVEIGAEKAPFTTKAVPLRKVEVDGVEFAWQHGEKGLQAAARTLAELTSSKRLGENVPEALWRATKRITFVEEGSTRDRPDDPFVGDKARGGNGTITVYRGQHIDAGLYFHESGHNFAKQVWGRPVPPADSRYGRAQKVDEDGHVTNSPSDYGRLDRAEDFAESSRLYSRSFDRNELKRTDPPRYEALKELFDRPPTTNAGRWAVQAPDQQAQAFQSWLRAQTARLITSPEDKALWDEYARAGFARGSGRAFDEVGRGRVGAAARVPAQLRSTFVGGARDQFLREVFSRPKSADRVRLISAAAFADYEGVTGAMAVRMGRVVADGLLQGWTPHRLARELTQVADLTLSRALQIARDEVVRSASEGTLDAMERMGVEEVTAAVEWTTSGLPTVCPRCAALEGVVLTVEEARGLIPLHSRCNCSWLPAVTKEKGQVRKATDIRDAFEEADVDRAVAGRRPRLAGNAFCPTGEGGGVDPTCSPSGGGGGTRPPAVEFDPKLLDVALADTQSDRATLFANQMELDAALVIKGKPRGLDARLRSGQYDVNEVAAAWSKTRELLRSRYGDVVTLYRADAPAAEHHENTVTVLMGDRKLAEKFIDRINVKGERVTDREVKAYRVRVNDIIAVPVFERGDSKRKYYEVVVKKSALTTNADPAIEFSRAWAEVTNAFCPTGEGGGVDPSCGKGKDASAGRAKIPARPTEAQVERQRYDEENLHSEFFLDPTGPSRLELVPISVLSRTHRPDPDMLEGYGDLRPLAKAYKTGKPVAPVSIDEEGHLYDGRHRLEAARQAGMTHIWILRKPPEGGFADVKNFWTPVANAFCPTGPGGGIDPKCGKDEGAGAGASPARPFVKVGGVVFYNRRLWGAAVRIAMKKARDARKPTKAQAAAAGKLMDEKGADRYESNIRGNTKDRAASRQRLLKEFGDGTHCPCTYCGRRLDETTVERDKIYTAREGGRYTHDNLVPACRGCNASRGDTAWDKIKWGESVKTENEWRPVARAF